MEGTTVGGQPASADGIVTVTFNNGTAKRLALVAAPDPTWVRVVAKCTDSGITTKKIVDVAIGAADVVTMSIPAGNYDIRALYYVKEGSLKRMLSYGKVSKSVAANANNDVNITPSDTSATVVAMSAEVYASSSYSAANAPTATIPSSSPLRPDWALFAQTSEFTAPLHLAAATVPTASHVGEAVPGADSPGTLYFQGEFFIDPLMVATAAESTSWVFTSPNPRYTDYAPVYNARLLVNYKWPPMLMASINMAPLRGNSTPYGSSYAYDSFAVNGFIGTGGDAFPACFFFRCRLMPNPRPYPATHTVISISRPGL